MKKIFKTIEHININCTIGIEILQKKYTNQPLTPVQTLTQSQIMKRKFQYCLQLIHDQYHFNQNHRKKLAIFQLGEELEHIDISRD